MAAAPVRKFLAEHYPAHTVIDASPLDAREIRSLKRRLPCERDSVALLEMGEQNRDLFEETEGNVWVLYRKWKMVVDSRGDFEDHVHRLLEPGCLVCEEGALFIKCPKCQLPYCRQCIVRLTRGACKYIPRNGQEVRFPCSRRACMNFLSVECDYV